MFYSGEILDGTYQILEEIGKGGTGVVYRAYHLRLKKYVVVKKLKENMAGREEVRIEVDILKRLHHMYLPQVYDFVETGGQIYTVMDYIDGEDLQHYLDRGYHFAENQLLLWMKQLAEVLDYLHSQKKPILHSDIKPGNIMITSEGNVCLIDFNISLDGEHNADLVGLSRWYAAPEQYEKARMIIQHQDASPIVLDGRMDLYSLGASFYSLMSGRLPDRNSPDFLPVTDLGLPYSSAFLAVVEKMMAVKPGKRYQSAGALRKSLDNLYKLDAGYRKLQRTGWTLWAVCGVCIACGFLSSRYGWQMMCRQEYEKNYQIFYESQQRNENRSTALLGEKLLNKRKYQRIFEKDPEEKAQILHAVGNIYFGEEDYGSAEKYYEEAAAVCPDSEYFRDYTVNALRIGKISAAKRILREAKQTGIWDDELLLAEQEIAFAENHMEKTVEIAATLKSAAVKENVAYSCILGAKACGALGMQEEQAAFLEEAYAKGKDKRCLRELGSTYLEIAEGGDTRREICLKRAEECYMTLIKSYAGSYRDRMNLAIIRENLGNYKDSEKVLEELKEEYPEEYEIYMHLSYVALKQQLEKSEKERSYTRPMEYFRKAEKLYRRAGSPQDPAMFELSEYLGQIEEAAG